jgi:hypothetical protein
MTIVLNGTTGITNDGGYTGDGIVFADTTPANTLVTTTGGNVGIGTSSPGTSSAPGKLAISAPGVGVGVASSTENGTAYHFAAYNANPATPELSFFVSNDVTGLRLGNARGPLQFYAGSTTVEEMRLDTSGRLLVNTTAPPTTSWNNNAGMNVQYGVQLTHTGNPNIWRQLSWSGDTGDAGLFFPGGSSLGSVSNVAILSAAGAWVNASDGRQKTNVRDLNYGIDAVMQLKPRRYNRTDVLGEFVGFVAQELKDVIPEVVSGSDETFYGVSYGELVAVAFKAIQEQQAIITALTARVEALEGTQP